MANKDNWNQVLGLGGQEKLPKDHSQDDNWSLPESTPKPLVSQKQRILSTPVDESLVGSSSTQETDWSLPSPKLASTKTNEDWAIPAQNPEKAGHLDQLYAPYREALEEYEQSGEPGKDDSQIFQSGQAGYKFHLNVAPEDVRAVSQFLIGHGYHHKYLDGSEVESGKIFTVYTGSKRNTEMIVQEISDGIEQLLLPPTAAGEAAYAPRIVGRFVGGAQLFRKKRCVNGMTLLNWSNDVEAAKRKAQEEYGDYFGGGITLYSSKN